MSKQSNHEALLLTSKEIIERTGISRATLNNYIGSGLVPRPQVLPPGPQDGGAPRIGYFPDDTIDRVETIQRLKQQGWSIARIAEHFAAQARGAGETIAATPVAQHPVASAEPVLPPRAVPPAPAPSLPATDPALRLWLDGVKHPAYLVTDGFRLAWANEQARQDTHSPLAGRTASLGANVLGQLFATDDDAARDAILRFHLEVARDRGADTALLFAGLPADQVERLQAMVHQGRRAAPGLVTEARIPGAGGQPARAVYAVHFREGVLFAYQPVPAAAVAETDQQQDAGEPVLTPVAVLVTSLQDAAGLWVKLTAPEYFELLNDVGAELDRVFRRNSGQPGRQTGEVLACYFLPQQDSSYLWNALAAAQQTRDAMRQVSRRWQARKSWDVELFMNIGIDEGQEWMGVVGTAGQREARVLGDAADRAEQLARCGRVGAILVTRSLVGKLPQGERQRLTYGVHRAEGDAPLLFTFARLEEIAASTLPARFAELAVAELLELNFPSPQPRPGGAG